MPAGSWPLVEELFARGDAEFVVELRGIHDPERLGKFAAAWYADKRPAARQFLFDYLDQPLNCYRHEALVKRLYKLAEAAGDDELMGIFLVAFDRSIRRGFGTARLRKYELFPTMAAAKSAQLSWAKEGYSAGSIWGHDGSFNTYAYKLVEVVRTPSNTKMPRPPEKQQKRAEHLNDRMRQRFERRFLLFSLPTRRYLRRRTWRYFRKIGNTDPERYLKAATQFLLRYTDKDVDSDIHLLDNWGLVHALFYDCPALTPKAKGWEFAAGKGAGDLVAAPRFAAAWLKNPEAVFALMLKAQCYTVRRWAMELLKRYHAAWLDARPVGDWLALIDHADLELASFGFDQLERMPDVTSIPVEEWLKRLDGDDLNKLTRLADFLKRKLNPARVTKEVALQLAVHRVKPVAEFGFELVKSKVWSEDEANMLLTLVQGENEAVRSGMLPWLRSELESHSPLPDYPRCRSEWMIEWFDSRYADVREAAWQWYSEVLPSPIDQMCPTWAESPYDDVRIRGLEQLEQIKPEYSGDSLITAWFNILTNIVRGGRQKPGVVKSLVERIQRSQPDEAEKLFPLLAVAVRSLRGPEFRAGLAGLVQLWKTSPELRPRIGRQFPEFSLGG
jgi:hypothetical protein